MKKLVSVIAMLTVLIIGGCSIFKSGPTKEEMIEVLKSKEVIEAIERAMKNRDKNFFTNEGIIKKYTIDYDNAKWEHRGAIEIKIVVNENNDLYFIYTLRKFNGKYEISSSTNSTELEELLESNK